MPKLPYRPPPTDAYTQLAGWDRGPVDALLFSSDDEADACLKRMIDTKVIPPTATLVDDQYAYGPIIYGKDGRKIWCIWFKLKGQQYEEPVGRILWLEGNYPGIKLWANPDSSGIDIVSG